jgi:uncharacterized protein (DUF433 family)
MSVRIPKRDDCLTRWRFTEIITLAASGDNNNGADEDFVMNDGDEYKHLERRPESNYRQLFIKGRRIRAEVLYRQTVGLEPRTPEQVAEDYELPLDLKQA